MPTAAYYREWRAAHPEYRDRSHDDADEALVDAAPVEPGDEVEP